MVTTALLFVSKENDSKTIRKVALSLHFNLTRCLDQVLCLLIQGMPYIKGFRLM